MPPDRSSVQLLPEIEGKLEPVQESPLWQMDIAELTGHNIESRGREEVNRLLGEGWILLHNYTLKYEENGVWLERPMAILGRPRNPAELGRP